MKSEFINSTVRTKRTPLANEVANRLAEHISKEEYMPGDRIPNEFELAELFNVGRGTIREAVKLLVSRNVLEIRPAKGTFVCENPGIINDPIGLNFVPNKLEMVSDMYELRTILECYAVRKAAAKITEAEAGRLRELADRIQSSLKDHELCTTYDIEFHKYIAEHCGNIAMPILLPMIHTSMTDLNRLQFDRQWNVANQGHYAIIDALLKHDAELAEREMMAHLEYGREKMKLVKE